MKSLLWPVAGLALTALAVMMVANNGHAQMPGPGPGNQPATLKGVAPWLEGSPSSSNTTAVPSYPGSSTSNTGMFAVDSSRPFPDFQEKPDPNQDIYVTSAQGAWLICVNWYSGPESAQLAREMVKELRETYKVPAFVFSKGAEERKQEYERVKGLIEKQRDFLSKNNLPVATPLRIAHRHIEDQYAVLVGGYRDNEACKRALDGIRKMPPDQLNRKLLPKLFYSDSDDKGNLKKAEMVYVNPFAKAFPVRNPAVKVERPAEWDKLDMDVLQKLNRGEPHSLLNCKKPFTLVVKQFSTPSAVQPQSASGKFLATLKLGGKSDIDTAAQNAHNLAELFRKSANLEAFVLHTRYASYVTVGGFDSADDASPRGTQNMLVSRLKVPQALPMPVPH